MIEKMMQAIDYGNFETNIDLQFTSFHKREDCLKLTCSIFPKDEDTLIDQWVINCLHFQEYRLDSLDSYEQEEFEITDDHPYLWDYHKTFTELYFKGENMNTKALIGALYLKHNNLTNRLIPFGRYLNIMGENGFANDLEWLLMKKQGLFSEAPESLNHAYQELLSDYGFTTSLLTRKTELPCRDCRLLRLGKSYVIAKEFKAIRVDAEHWLL